MTTPEIVMWAVVGCLLAGCVVSFVVRRNLAELAAALALSVSWLVGQAYYLRTGNNLALSEYIVADIGVVTAILAKAIVRAGPKTYPSLWSRVKSLRTDLTVWDQFVLGLFLLGSWPIYVSTLHPYYVYWALYYITIAQFLFAGMEPLANWWANRRPRLMQYRDDNILDFAPAYSRRAKRYYGAEPPPSSRSVTQRTTRAEVSV